MCVNCVSTYRLAVMLGLEQGGEPNRVKCAKCASTPKPVNRVRESGK